MTVILPVADVLIAALALAGLAGLGWWLLPLLDRARGRERWRHER
jgi:hypothetical protein